MGTDHQLERPPAMRAADAETGTQVPRRAVRERRYRPSKSITGERPGAATTVASPGNPTLVGEGGAPPLERRVSAWNNTAVWVSVVAVALVLGALALAALGTQTNFAATFESFSVRFLSLFIEAAPFLLLGTLVSGLIDSFVSPDHIMRFVPRNRLLGVLMGTFGGFVFPVCECGVVPVVRQLYSKKLPAAVGVAFLLGAPVMNPIVLLSTLAVFPTGPVLVGRYVITAIVAIAVGLAFALGRLKLELRGGQGGAAPEGRGGSRTAPTDASVSPLSYATLRPPSLPVRLRDSFSVAVHEFFEMGRFLIIGCLLAAGMQTLISQDTLAALGQGPLSSVLTMQAIAFILSVCSTVDAFLVLAFTGTFTTGSILAFLTFGPMVDIKTTTMYLGIFKGKTVALLTVLPLVLTGIIGILLNVAGLK